jgi:hypothetical protein
MCIHLHQHSSSNKPELHTNHLSKITVSFLGTLLMHWIIIYAFLK